MISRNGSYHFQWIQLLAYKHDCSGPLPRYRVHIHSSPCLAGWRYMSCPYTRILVPVRRMEEPSPTVVYAPLSTLDLVAMDGPEDLRLLKVALHTSGVHLSAPETPQEGLPRFSDPRIFAKAGLRIRIDGATVDTRHSARRLPNLTVVVLNLTRLKAQLGHHSAWFGSS